MTEQEIIEGNKLIAEFMGYIYSYKCDVWRGGYCLKNVDLLSNYQFISLAQVLEDAKIINSESVPFINNGNIAIGKYGEDKFYPNVIFFSTDSLTIPVTLRYNDRFQQYHCSWNWIAPVVIEICKDRELTSGEILQLADVNLAWSRKDLTEIWVSVVNFIKWYNLNKS